MRLGLGGWRVENHFQNCRFATVCGFSRSNSTKRLGGCGLGLPGGSKTLPKNLAKSAKNAAKPPPGGPDHVQRVEFPGSEFLFTILEPKSPESEFREARRLFEMGPLKM